MKEYNKDIFLRADQDSFAALLAEIPPALARAVEGQHDAFYAGRIQVRYEIIVKTGKTTMRVVTESC